MFGCSYSNKNHVYLTDFRWGSFIKFVKKKNFMKYEKKIYN